MDSVYPHCPVHPGRSGTASAGIVSEKPTVSETTPDLTTEEPEGWYAWQDLNLRPSAPEADALSS